MSAARRTRATMRRPDRADVVVDALEVGCAHRHEVSLGRRLQERREGRTLELVGEERLVGGRRRCEGRWVRVDLLGLACRGSHGECSERSGRGQRRRGRARRGVGARCVRSGSASSARTTTRGRRLAHEPLEPLARASVSPARGRREVAPGENTNVVVLALLRLREGATKDREEDEHEESVLLVYCERARTSVRVALRQARQEKEEEEEDAQ